MLSSDQTKAGGKSKSRKTKAQDRDKARERNRKVAAQVPEPEQPRSAPEQVEAEAPVAALEIAAPDVVTETAAADVTTETAAVDVAPETATSLPSPDDTSPVAPVAIEEATPVSYRAIADAWGNYSRTSLEQTRSYFEKLAGVRSLGAAFEVQAEFAKQACDSFVAQSQRIGELQGEMTKQRLKRLEGFMQKMTQGTREH
jgi:hypothetical protein